VLYTPPSIVERKQGIPSNFNIISNTTGDVRINGNSTFYGTVVAPYATVRVNGSAEKFGAVLGKEMILLGTGGFHWDMAARSPAFNPTVLLLSYREISAAYE
jgi:hypothetical protein